MATRFASHEDSVYPLPMTNADKPAKDDVQLEGIPFAELREGRCKFPLGGHGEPAERFCGKPSIPGASYCPECQKKVYYPSKRGR